GNHLLLVLAVLDGAYALEYEEVFYPEVSWVNLSSRFQDYSPVVVVSAFVHEGHGILSTALA
ncbi:hypothetical protein AVEN_29280-1, partial [Araneus ventricosus]